MKRSRRSAHEHRLCLKCENYFESTAALNAHLLTHHKGKNQEENKKTPLRSKTPRTSVDNPDTEKKQEEKEKKKRGRKRTDYKNGFGIPTGGYYVEDPRVEDGSSSNETPWKAFACLSCPFRTQHVTSLRVHIATRHKAWSFSCSECEARFAVATALRQHERAAHPQALARRLKEEADAESGSHCCSQCSSVFESRRALKLHERIHRVLPKVAFCEICQRNFANMYVLARHRKVVHEKSVVKDRFLCKVCGRQCATKYTLEAHEATHFSFTIACPVQGCSSSFSSASALSMHKRRTHSRNRFPCPSCDQVFQYRSVLKLHHRAKHGHMAEFTCPICSKTLRHPAGRLRHMRAHSSTKTRRCDLCDFATHQSSSLKRHKWLLHQKPKRQIEDRSKPAEASRRELVSDPQVSSVPPPSSSSPQTPLHHPQKPSVPPPCSPIPQTPLHNPQKPSVPPSVVLSPQLSLHRPQKSSDPPPPSSTPLPTLDFLTSLRTPLEPDYEAFPIPSRVSSERMLVFNCETGKTELIEISRLKFDGQKVVLMPSDEN